MSKDTCRDLLPRRGLAAGANPASHVPSTRSNDRQSDSELAIRGNYNETKTISPTRWLLDHKAYDSSRDVNKFLDLLPIHKLGHLQQTA